MNKRYWKVSEVRELRLLYSNTGNKELGLRFGRAPKAVGLLALKLGLKKSAQYMAKHCRYQQGHATWNKGKPWNPSPATQFRKGHRGPRQKPVGTERIERDGVMVKVAEPSAWVPKARVVWEKHFGQIPEGMIVRLKDSDMRNCAPENLTLISRRENAQINARIRKPRRKARPALWVRQLHQEAA